MENTYDFIAIDFETATDNMNSACSLGIVCVSNFQIVDQKYYLIQPPDNYYLESNTSVHHLSASDTESAPTFDKIWPEIIPLFESTIIVAHNIRFDLSVLHACLELYSLECNDFQYIDSIAISNRAMRHIDSAGYSKSLIDRAAFFNIPVTNHHNALDDAKTCALITIESVKTTNRKSLHTYCSSYRRKTLHQYSELKPMTKFTPHKRYSKQLISELAPTQEVTNTEHPFFNKNIVITGELNSMSRNLAMQKITDVGGIIKSTVSSKTDYLIVGVQDPAAVKDGKRSSKEIKAESLISSGYNIQILHEDDLLKLI